MAKLDGRWSFDLARPAGTAADSGGGGLSGGESDACAGADAAAAAAVGADGGGWPVTRVTYEFRMWPKGVPPRLRRVPGLMGAVRTAVARECAQLLEKLDFVAGRVAHPDQSVRAALRLARADVAAAGGSFKRLAPTAGARAARAASLSRLASAELAAAAAAGAGNSSSSLSSSSGGASAALDSAVADTSDDDGFWTASEGGCESDDEADADAGDDVAAAQQPQRHADCHSRRHHHDQQQWRTEAAAYPGAATATGQRRRWRLKWRRKAAQEGAACDGADGANVRSPPNARRRAKSAADLWALARARLAAA